MPPNQNHPAYIRIPAHLLLTQPVSQGRRRRGPQEAGLEGRFFAARLFVAALPLTFTPEFLSSTVAASFAARAIAGSFRSRSCAIEPSTSSASCVASASGSGTPSCISKSRNQRRRLSLKATAIFRTDRSSPSSATALTKGQPRKSFAEKRRSSESKVPRICSTGDLSDERGATKRRAR